MTDPSTESSGGTGNWRAVLAPTRTYVIWFLLFAVVGVAVCFIPLFNLLGYESAAFFGALVGPVVVFLTLHNFRHGLLEEPLAAERVQHSIKDFFGLGIRHCAMLVVPAVALCLNALRVKNCDFVTGGLFWLTIPVMSVWVGQGVGWAVAAAVPPRRWLRNVVAVVLLAASVVSFGLHLALEPPITGHQLFLGYFSGSIYDEALALPPSLLAYRGLNLLLVVFAVTSIEGVRRFRSTGGGRWMAVVGMIAVVGSLAVWMNRHALGIGIDRGYIESELGGRLESEHFVIHYPERSRFLEQLDELAEDHEFRYREMEEYFETDPAAEGKIHSYVYPNREEKGRLMGARRTLVAKIWLGEVHVLWPNYGHHWLAHELAHLFTAPFATGPLKLSMQRGVGVNMGLVEGIATAADWPANNLTPHEAAAALRRLEMAPDVRRIVGATGFWTQSSRRAYTVVGSFIQFLIDRHGIDRFKRAYGQGAFREAYGEPVDVLVGRWEAFLDEMELSEAAMETAHFLYRRSSIFEKVCARTTAELRRRAKVAARRGDVGEMRALYESLLEFAPNNLDYRIEFAQRLEKAGEPEASFEMVEELLDGDLPPVQRARLLQLQGDLGWKRGDSDRARQAYESCLEVGLPVDFERMIRAKLASIEPERRGVRELAFGYLVDDPPGAVAMYYPMEWLRRRPEDPLAAYLAGRRLWQHREWSVATEYLRRAQGRFESEALEAETNRMLGRALYFQGKYATAARAFSRLRDSPIPRYRAVADEWRRRIDWRRGFEGAANRAE